MLATISLVELLASPASSQPVFDNMKCYKVRDPQPGKHYTADLVPKLTQDFSTELGDRIFGGAVQKGCRIRVPAQYYCIEVEPQNAHEVSPPYNPAQWTVDGPEPAERLCYKLKCPSVSPKDLAIIDPFGTRTVTLLGKTSYFCTPVSRQLPPNSGCSLSGAGVCGGICPPGQTCFAISTQDCGCMPDEQACTSSAVCQDGFCLGVWETCTSLPIGGCGCSHP